ncbi:DNA cytosine methyltransferase [Micromonospora maritima]|uniref:DNA cytosine methyltransferase n=1 Tax=Micromonospora maritima TaxID=986711 RepID=UPI001FE95FBA|nr:DNA cytosine methyltransferase [Micromonospora maritima]
MLSLFAGIGGLDLGLERAGMRVVGQVEIDAFCRSVLARHWPEVPCHDDVRTAARWWRSRRRPAVHVVAGGFPCQPVSDAGRKLAQEDERWLWPEMAEVIAAVRPTWVVGENVPGLRTRGLADVLRDLDRLGYRARAGYISACEMGAPHPRKRLFVLAHAEGEGRCPGRPQRRGAAAPDGDLPHVGGPRRRTGWPAEPRVGRVAYGVPSGVDRRRALGNAVVPAVAEHIGRLITTRYPHR